MSPCIFFLNLVTPKLSRIWCIYARSGFVWKLFFDLTLSKRVIHSRMNIKYLDQFLGKFCSVIVWKKGLKITFMLIKLNVSQRKSSSDICVTRKLAWCMFACMLKLHADIREILSLGIISTVKFLCEIVTLCRLCIYCLSN